MRPHFDWRGVLSRTLFSFFVVFALYNPSGHSYWHWVTAGHGGFWPKLAAGLLLLLVHGVIWISIVGVLKWRGIILVALAVIASFNALGTILPPSEAPPMSLITGALGVLSLVYAAGLSYSHIHHRLAGIAHADTV